MHSGGVRHDPRDRRRPRRPVPDGARPGLREAEVMDVDEEALRAGRVSATTLRRRLRPARPPARPGAEGRVAPAATQASTRSAGRSPARLRRASRCSARARRRSASSPRSGCEGTLLGVDAVEDGRLVGRDLNEAQLLELLGSRSARVVVSRRRRPGLRARPRQPAAEPGGDRTGRAREPRDRRLAREAARPRSAAPARRHRRRRARPELSGFRRVRVAPGHSVVVPVAAS